MERHGGWLKRQVVKNRKNAVEALSNRVLVEEQVHQLIALIKESGPVLTWRNRALCHSKDWTSESADTDRHTHTGYKGRLLDKESKSYTVSDATYRALAKYLETEAWTEERQRVNTLIRFSLKDVKRRCVDVVSYRTFISASDYGRLSWRTARSKKEAGAGRDCSWTKVRRLYRGGRLADLLVTSVSAIQGRERAIPLSRRHLAQLSPMGPNSRILELWPRWRAQVRCGDLSFDNDIQLDSFDAGGNRAATHRGYDSMGPFASGRSHSGHHLGWQGTPGGKSTRRCV